MTDRLPPGFQLDDEPPSPPPGFVLDEPAEPYSGQFLPFSKDAEGNVSFDPNAGVLGVVKRAVEFPAEAVRGNIDPLSDEGIRRAVETGLTFSPISPASRAARLPPTPTPAQLRQAGGKGNVAAAKRAEQLKPPTNVLQSAGNKAMSLGALAAGGGAIYGLPLDLVAKIGGGLWAGGKGVGWLGNRLANRALNKASTATRRQSPYWQNAPMRPSRSPTVPALLGRGAGGTVAAGGSPVEDVIRALLGLPEPGAEAPTTIDPAVYDEILRRKWAAQQVF